MKAVLVVAKREHENRTVAVEAGHLPITPLALAVRIGRWPTRRLEGIRRCLRRSPRDEPGLPIVIVRFGRVDEVLRPGEGPVFIGRELPAQLRIDDTRISRTHARIESTGAQWVVVDEASTNGVFLNGERVSDVPVTDGMTLHLGHPEGIAVWFSFIDPDAGTMMATGVMPARTTDDTVAQPEKAAAGSAAEAQDGPDIAGPVRR